MTNKNALPEYAATLACLVQRPFFFQVRVTPNYPMFNSMALNKESYLQGITPEIRAYLR